MFADRGQTPGVHAQLPELPGSHPHKNAKIVASFPWLFLLSSFRQGQADIGSILQMHSLGLITSDLKPRFSAWTVAILAQGTHWAVALVQAFSTFLGKRVSAVV